ncbi:MAG TPA: hypothetical protein VGT61_14395 [Thermomicrobiales bacterium]|nr:hypothetical protein [Thermomicrobiales bacterium]
MTDPGHLSGTLGPDTITAFVVREVAVGFIESIEKTRFVGSHRGRALEVTVDIFESPMRVWLAIDGVRGERQDVPAQFDLGDGAVLSVEGKGVSISECAIVEDDVRTGLELAPDSGIRRYVRWADTKPLAGVVRNGVFFVAIPVLVLLAFSGLLLAPFMAGPLDAIGLGQPDDLPWPSWSWLYGVLAAGLLFGLGAEEDARKAWGRYLAPTRDRIVPSAPAGGDSAAGSDAGRPIAGELNGKPEWEVRLDQVGGKIDRGWVAITTSRFTGRHAGRNLEVVFDFFDEPTHARLLIDGNDQGNKGVPARFDLGNGATLEAEATQWAVVECAVVTAESRVRLRPAEAQVERWHDRFFRRHPQLEALVGAIGAVVITLAGILGLIDLYNLVMRIGGRILGRLVDRTPLPDEIPLVSTVLGWLPDEITLPIALTWWQALLVAAIPALFAFDRDVRRSNRRFGTGRHELGSLASELDTTQNPASGRGPGPA